MSTIKKKESSLNSPRHSKQVNMTHTWGNRGSEMHLDWELRKQREVQLQHTLHSVGTERSTWASHRSPKRASDPRDGTAKSALAGLSTIEWAFGII